MSACHGSYSQFHAPNVSIWTNDTISSNDNVGLKHGLNRGSYISTHVLLSLFNELGKRDKKRDLSSILLLFRHEFTKFNNTGARMLNSSFHMTLKLLVNVIT